MGKGHSVLRALSILSLEEIRQLSSVEEEILAFEQVAGGEWAGGTSGHPKKLAKVLSFPLPEEKQTATIKDLEPLAPMGEEQESALNELSLDFILSQRELWKYGVEKMGLSTAIEEYLRQAQVVSIQEEIPSEGKSRIRFITTQGLLINKKQS